MHPQITQKNNLRNLWIVLRLRLTRANSEFEHDVVTNQVIGLTGIVDAEVFTIDGEGAVHSRNIRRHADRCWKRHGLRHAM